MKRFKTQPSEFYAMDKATRMEIFQREYDLVKKEYEEHEKLKNTK